MQDAKPLFDWAQENGEARIVDRILIRLLPEMLRQEQRITAQMIEEQPSLAVSDTLYAQLLTVTQELVGQTYPGASSHV
ncbi:MAG: hypothetical protein PHI49_03180 [Halothiobacillaceae bacterium]|jgi:hypothetical protein|nr:hypothetical protein [Halothiobacillaceae bacterium]MDY0050866.1 hypothetical protein [Halothiobacillaceae bacterium]